MNREDTLKIMSVLKAAYPNYYKDMKKNEAEGIVALWTDMFQDEPYQLVAMAVKSHIATDTKGFPPHIGVIKDAIVKLHTAEELTEQEAWALVSAATRRSSYYSTEEYAKLPPVVQRIVGSPEQLKEWAAMDTATLNSVVASNFQRSYKARAGHERELMALPSGIKQAMEQLAGRMDIKRLEA